MAFMIDTETLLAVGAGLGVLAGGFGIGKAKLLPLRRNNGNSKAVKCPDAGCHNTVLNTSEEVKELKTDFKSFQDDIFPKINATAEGVKYIQGFLKGKFGE
jgi:hypothetical protein